MEKAIQKAIEGGWSLDRGAYIQHEYLRAISDPLFWQALGKAEGWDEFSGFHIKYFSTWENMKEKHMLAWQWQMHKFIDHLAEGKDIDSFFEELLN